MKERKKTMRLELYYNFIIKRIIINIIINAEKLSSLKVIQGHRHVEKTLAPAKAK